MPYNGLKDTLDEKNYFRETNLLQQSYFDRKIGLFSLKYTLNNLGDKY